jgi:hypothetical protein
MGRPSLQPLRLFLLLGVALLLSGCPVDFLDLETPEVLNLTVAPSTIAVADTGSTSQTFSVEISVANFDDPIEFATVFIQDGNREAQFEDSDLSIDGNLIIITNIAYTWFQGYTAGTYDIGAEIISETVQHSQRNLATVTITP